MPRRIVRTTRRIQYNEDGEPIETVVSSSQEQQPTPQSEPVAEETEVYQPETGLERVTYTYASPPAATRRIVRTVVEPHDWAQSIRSATQRQMQVLREFDLRLNSLEDANRRTEGSFERATWWALWGILMLILGAALVVIILLIFSGLFH